MSRRSHKKSKTGCSECKARHVKCDESRPSCINCQTADFPCSFSSERGITATAPYSSSLPSKTSASPAFLNTGDRSDRGSKIYAQPSNTPAVNMDHLNLFYHFQTETVVSLGSRMADLESSNQMVIRCGLSTPYLMHEMLAIAATHLSIMQPAKEDFHRRQATELQQSALSHFNNSSTEVTSTNCIPMFLFSSFLGIHLLCDTLRFRDGNLGTFLNRFTQYLNLHRGVRSITNSSWHLLQQSELASWLKASEAMTAVPDGHGNELSRLRSFIRSSDITESSREVYEEAVKHLQLLFDSHRRIQDLKDSAQLVFAWPVIVSAAYSDLLSQKRTVALIILAHYAVLLHAHRGLWLIGDGGEFLIRSISGSLGHLWADWLEWPLSILESDLQIASNP
jgi:hypothetical protein